MALLDVRNLKKVYTTRLGSNQVQERLRFLIYWRRSTGLQVVRLFLMARIQWILKKRNYQHLEERTLALYSRILIC